MITSIVFLAQPSLAIDGAAELASPDNQRVIQQSAPFQIGDQRITCAIHFLTKNGEQPSHIGMHIPSTFINLCEPHSAFGHTPRQKAVICKRPRFLRIRPIQVPCRLGFLAEIRKLGYGCLHPEGHLVLRDPRVSLRISHLRKCLQVDLLNSIQHFAAHLAIHAIRIAQKEHRIPTRSQADPCILRRKESTAPQPR